MSGRKLQKGIISGLVMASFPLTQMAMSVSAAPSGVNINSAFPDQEFRSYVSENFDKDHNGYLSSTEISKVKDIRTFELSIKDYTGIGYFTKLEHLECSYTKADVLDLTQNTGLKYLDINKCHLKSVDLSNNTLLEVLYCSDNDFTGLDLSNNTELVYLSCCSTDIKSIKLSKCKKLKEAWLDYNYQLTSLDVSSNKELESLDLYCSGVSELKLGKNENLKSLSVVGIEANEVDISGCPKIVDVYLHGEHPSTELDQLYYYRDGYDYKAYLSCSPAMNINYDGNSKMEWKKSGGKWYYMDGNGLKTIGMKEIDHKWYYFDKNGVMQTGWVDVDGEEHWHYFDKNGVMQNGWFKVGTKWDFCYWYEPVLRNGIYDLGYGNNELYKFDKDGAMVTGWHKNNDGSYYYFTSAGAAKGWKQIGKVWYYFDKETAVMVTGVQKIDGSIYLFASSGAMQKSGWKQSGSDWYYLTKSGAAYSSKWLKSGGKWYYFDADGRMVSNRSMKIGGQTYQFDADGVMK